MKNWLQYVYGNRAPLLLCALVYFLFNTVSGFAQPDNWQQKQSLGVLVTARAGAVGFGIDNKGYISTGFDSAGNYKNDLWEFDIYTNSWTQKASFAGGPRTGAVGFSIDGKGYIGTGRNGSIYYRDFWQYDPATNSWLQKAAFAGEARSDATGFVVAGMQGGGKGYISMGMGAAGTLKNDVWQYDPVVDAWIQKTNFPAGPRSGATSFNLGTIEYLGAGKDSAGNYKSDFWEYIAGLDVWLQVASLGGSPRTSATGFSLTSLYGTKGYIVGGYAGGSNYLNDFWEYDAQANTWTQKSDFYGGARAGAMSFITSAPAFVYLGTGQGPAGYFNDLWQFDGARWTGNPGFGGSNARAFAVSFSIGNKGYFGTGYDGNGKKDFWEYDPASNSWTQLADFAGSARSHAVGIAIGNKGYIGLGSAWDNNYKNDFWEYDPAINAWTQKANFGGLGKVGATGFSIGNKGYVGTGSYRTQSLNDFWEYDPATDTWTKKANFTGVARENAIGFRIGGKGYLGTGQSYNTYLNDFFEYDPAVDSWTQKANFGGDGRTTATGFGIGNKGYAGIGQNSNSYFNDFWEYDPGKDAWTKKTNFGGLARATATGFSIDEKNGYIGFGSASDGLKNDLWQYTPAGVALPVHFISVKAYKKNTSVVVSWTVAQDFNIKEYQVEKSMDGINFHMAGTQKVDSPGQVTSYSFSEAPVTSIANYYRVKAVAVDGKITISVTVTVTAGTQWYIAVFPNPFTAGWVTIYISSQQSASYRAKVYNEKGQLVSTYMIAHPGGAFSQTIYLPSSLANAVYIMNIESENGQKKTFRLLLAR